MVGLVAIAPTAAAQTTGFVEMQSRANLDHPKNSFMLDAGISRALNNRFGVSAFSLLTGTWGELYAGPTFKPSKGTNLGLSLGGEQGVGSRIAPRYALSATVQGEGLFLNCATEANNGAVTGKDDSGFWYNVVATYSPTKALALGLQLRRPDGLGPRISWKMGPIQTWVSWTPLLPETGEWRPGRFISGIQLFL
jgi:hypothetical protein